MHGSTLPYIGITDFTHVSQVAKMRNVLDAEHCSRLLHVGVMMSYKTLKGLPTKWAGVFVPKEDLHQIFVKRDKVLNVLHYADYDDQTTSEDLIEAVSWAGADVDAVQLDMIWPDLELLEDLRRSHVGRNLKLIVQVNRLAIDEEDAVPEKVAERLLRYKRFGLLDYALFDLSGGQGKLMDSAKLLANIQATLSRMPELSVAVAGGLGPSSMRVLEPILEEVPDVSIDAQSRLRPSHSALDPVDCEMAAGYLREAAALFKRYK